MHHRHNLRLLDLDQLWQFRHHRASIGRLIEVTQCDDLFHGHDIGHRLALLAHQLRHRLAHIVLVKLVDRIDLGLRQLLAGLLFDIGQKRCVHLSNNIGHIDIFQRGFDMLVGDGEAFFIAVGLRSQRKGKSKCQGKGEAHRASFWLGVSSSRS